MLLAERDWHSYLNVVSMFSWGVSSAGVSGVGVSVAEVSVFELRWSIMA